MPRWLLIFAVAAAIVKQAQGDSLPSAIEYSAELNRIPAGCRSAAMGNCGAVQPFDAASIVWNPACASFCSRNEVSAEYASLYGGLSSQACASFRAPLQEGMSIGMAYEPFLSGDIDEWDSLPGTYLQRQMDPSMRANGSSKGIFTNTQNTLELILSKLFSIPIERPTSYSYPLPIEVASGLSFKGYWQTMNPDGKLRMGMNINCDLGLLFHVGLDYDISRKMVSRELYAGISIKDALGTSILWLHSPVQYQEKVDASEYFGVSYVDKTGILGANWTLTLGGERLYTAGFHGGIEAQYWNMVAFRAGLSDKTVTAGVGLTYKSYCLDYAFSFDDLAYSPLRLSLSYAF